MAASLAAAAASGSSLIPDALQNATTLLHPYFPVDAIISNYSANEWSVPALLGVFFSVCTALFLTTYAVTKHIQPTLTGAELLTTMWFVLSGAIHLFFEGYYAYNFQTLGGKQTLIGQMWKEYAFSDSRYLTQNSFVLCTETITAVCWGPGCLIVAALIVLRHPLRYPIQTIVSLGQFYGDALYYATSLFDHFVLGITYSRPEPFYFWVYFVLMNFFWIVIPGLLIYQSTVQGAAAFAALQQLQAGKKMR